MSAGFDTARRPGMRPVLRMSKPPAASTTLRRSAMMMSQQRAAPSVMMSQRRAARVARQLPGRLGVKWWNEMGGGVRSWRTTGGDVIRGPSLSSIMKLPGGWRAARRPEIFDSSAGLTIDWSRNASTGRRISRRRLAGRARRREARVKHRREALHRWRREAQGGALAAWIPPRALPLRSCARVFLLQREPLPWRRRLPPSTTSGRGGGTRSRAERGEHGAGVGNPIESVQVESSYPRRHCGNGHWASRTQKSIVSTMPGKGLNQSRAVAPTQTDHSEILSITIDMSRRSNSGNEPRSANR